MSPAEALSATFHNSHPFSETLKRESERLHLEQAQRFEAKAMIEKEIAGATSLIVALDKLLELEEEHPEISELLRNVAQQIGEAIGHVQATSEIAKHTIAEASMPTPAALTAQEDVDIVSDMSVSQGNGVLIGDDVADVIAIMGVGDVELVSRLPYTEEYAAPAPPEIFDAPAKDEREDAHPGDADAARRRALIDSVPEKVRSTVWRLITHAAGESGVALFNISRQATKYGLKSQQLRAGVEAWEAARFVERLPYHDASWFKLRILRR